MNPTDGSLNHFHWPESNYDAPIHVHRRTSVSHLLRAMNQITDVHVYTIDTQLDKPTHQHQPSIPSLIQMQAIHHENYSTVFVIDVQHLPHHSSSLFLLIRQLCRIIFSPSNQLIIWGKVIEQLFPFEQFSLFDSSHLTNILNLQQSFTDQWNDNHPHTADCLSRHQPTIDEYASADYLECFVNTDDLDSD